MIFEPYIIKVQKCGGRWKARNNRLKNGTCAVKFSDVVIKQQIYGVIQELMGFEKAEWLK